MEKRIKNLFKEISDELFSLIKNVIESFQCIDSYDKQLHDKMNKVTNNISNNEF